MRDKAKEERAVFRRFASISGLDINPSSIRSMKPPRPDISCRIGDALYYFEITRMAHRTLANTMGHYLSELTRKGTAPAPGADLYDDRAALREAIDRKVRATYTTDRRPVGLLVFTDGVFHPPHMPSQFARTVLEEKGPNQRWIGIWVYDSVYNRVVASWCRSDVAA